jgi:two-component system sensor histidine kinase RegB
MRPAAGDDTFDLKSVATISEAAQLRWAELRLRWLIGVRWGALIVWAGVALLSLIPSPDADRAGRVAGLIGIGVLGNAALAYFTVRGWRMSPGWILAADIIVFSMILATIGGATNPFTSFLLVYVALAALIVPPAWILVLAALAVACHALLFLAGPPAPVGHAGHSHASDFASHVRDMWVAFTLTAVLITYFVGRLSVARRKLELELASTAFRLERSQRLAALGTMATGAAHELGSPLGTIAIASAELRDRLEREHHPMASDARLVLDEVRRCREILDELVADAGLTAGETPRDITLSELLAGIPGTLPGLLADQVRIAVDDRSGPTALRLPVRAFYRCAINLIRNAADASPRGAAIVVDASRVEECVQIRFHDRGIGMPEDVLSRAGEPFFTTKPPGSGMGLGLHLCQSISSILGWRFEIHSVPGEGTTAEILIPILAPEAAS